MLYNIIMKFKVLLSNIIVHSTCFPEIDVVIAIFHSYLNVEGDMFVNNICGSFLFINFFLRHNVTECMEPVKDRLHAEYDQESMTQHGGGGLKQQGWY